MIAARLCSKPGCQRQAVATLTYDYHESTAVLGPLATQAEPHAYDLCDDHATHLTAPKGWQVVRLQTTFEPAPLSPDDLMALVDAVRRAADSEPKPVPPSATVHNLDDLKEARRMRTIVTEAAQDRREAPAPPRGPFGDKL